jgi:hypothetical protein
MAIANFDRIVKEASPEVRTVVDGTAVTDAFIHEGEMYIESDRHGGLYVPSSVAGKGNIRNYFSDDFGQKIRALMNAEFYRMGIIDENIPVDYGECCQLLLNRDPYFCRLHMIHMLGEIGYDPACPELREAMLHDLRGEIRGKAAETLGTLGDRSYADDLIKIARNQEDPVSYNALIGLGNMRDESTLPFLKEMLQEAVRIYHLGIFTEDHDLVWKGHHEIVKMTRVLSKFGKKGYDIIEGFAQDDTFGINFALGKGIEYSQIE